MSLLCADSTDFPALLRDAGIDLLWHPALSLASGGELLDLLAELRSGRRRLDALCIEGSMLRGWPAAISIVSPGASTVEASSTDTRQWPLTTMSTSGWRAV